VTQTKTSVSHRVLLVDDDEAVRNMMTVTLEHKGFDVISATNVTEALKLIITETFDVLITDLHMPNPSDGFAVITAMRHAQPEALRLSRRKERYGRYSFGSGRYHREAVRGRETGRTRPGEAAHSETCYPYAKGKSGRDIGALYQRCRRRLVSAGKKSNLLNHVLLTDKERMGYLAKLIEDLIVRLREPNIPGEESDSIPSAAAVAHGKLRQLQGYTPGMLVHDSRIAI
jgi:CheY-like chemotaxis protein